MATNAELFERRTRAVPRGPFHVAPIFVQRARGAMLWDVEGKEYIDFCGGIGVMNVGHNHPKVVEAIGRQASAFLHTCFHVAAYEPYVELAERLNQLVPIGGPCKTALFNSGAEAGENAVKISRAATGRPAVIGFERGFHGRTLLGMTLTGKCKPYTAGFGPFAPEVYRLPYEPFFAPPHDAGEPAIEHAARKALDHFAAYHVEPEHVACVMMEPVLGEGGFFPAHPAAMRVLRAWCAEHGILFVADEVQSGFARCGSMFAIERYGIEPDLVAMAKSMAGGLPLSGVTGRAELMDAPGVGGIGGTFGGNPIACAAALAVLDVIEQERLSQRANEIGNVIMHRFAAFEQRFPFVQGVRGLGAMCGLPIVDPETGQPDLAMAKRIGLAALDRGLLIMTASGNVLRTLMPLVIEDDVLNRGLDALEAAMVAEK